jgi:hypothetical protein
MSPDSLEEGPLSPDEIEAYELEPQDGNNEANRSEYQATDENIDQATDEMHGAAGLSGSAVPDVENSPLENFADSLRQTIIEQQQDVSQREAIEGSGTSANEHQMLHEGAQEPAGRRSSIAFGAAKKSTQKQVKKTRFHGVSTVEIELLPRSPPSKRTGAVSTVEIEVLPRSDTASGRQGKQQSGSNTDKGNTAQESGQTAGIEASAVTAAQRRRDMKVVRRMVPTRGQRVSIAFVILQ